MNKNSPQNKKDQLLYNADTSQDSCGVGFITHKQSKQTHDLLNKTHEALCTIPHRGGMSAEGIGDGAGVNIDLSLKFFRKVTEQPDLELGQFGVANFFFPEDHSNYDSAACELVNRHLHNFGLPVIKWRDIPVDNSVLNKASIKAQLPIKQVIFGRPEALAKDASHDEFEYYIQDVLLAIEEEGFTHHELDGFYPLSMSSRTQVYKGRLNSGEVIPYFTDLYDKDHEISTLFFHTRFSTNTAPATMMAQPFRYVAHNGELNTDKKNRLSELAIARQHGKNLVFPIGQSDSSRLDQTLSRRIHEDKLDIVTAILAMMPPAWENDTTLSADVKAMLEYFSLYEEKNDGPAALIFNDGIRVGARLDRLGLRPLRSVETTDYIAVMSEAGQIDFPSTDVLKRGRIEAGGMIYFDHSTGEIYDSHQVMERLAKATDYHALLKARAIHLDELASVALADVDNQHAFNIDQQHTAYSLNQESFKFLLDPMLSTGLEKISAMGYGITPNSLSGAEGGMSRYFSQRFAQVTNPPLDSLRESDGMTLRVALGAKPTFSEGSSKQLVINSPILQRTQLAQIRQQKTVSVVTIDALYSPDLEDAEQNSKNLLQALTDVCNIIGPAARNNTGIIIISDINISKEQAAIPALLLISAANQHLVKEGLRFNSSLVSETGQAVSAHDVATILGFGASAICPLSVHNRVISQYTADQQQAALDSYQKAVEKSLMKIMGKFGLCTAESYIGGEFFESNYIDTDEPLLKIYFPNINSSVGGIQFANIAASATEWHEKALAVGAESDIPFLGLFKERNEGAGHTFGNTSVREYINMTDEDILYVNQDKSPAVSDTAYTDFGYEKRTPEQVDGFGVTPAYRNFSEILMQERGTRPAALRDVMSYPADISRAEESAEFDAILGKQNLRGNINYSIRGLTVKPLENGFEITLSNDSSRQRLDNLATHFTKRFAEDHTFVIAVSDTALTIRNEDAHNIVSNYFTSIISARAPISLKNVQPAHEITAALATGAMSHGALLAEAHEAVAQGTNIAGAMSNSGEGGEHSSRFNTLRSSKIKQFASGRFGVWAGYLADLNIEEIEIKIAQGAKPGEGGQLPAAKVSVEIAAARGGTPKVELISPPPHHDTYSIEDLGQLIHDAKAARVRVVVKLVSSEGIGTIAVGVAKAGADVINVAGNTGGTGAAAVTSLKNTGRSPEIGISEVHQALSLNGLRDKVILRCSAAHQNGSDVVKSAILGGDSFEFGTTALMMLRCVMAKNCNIRCPAGLTTIHEEFKGDPRVLAQYFMNLAHEVRGILASLGYQSLAEIRGQTDLLHLMDHATMIGQMDFSKLLNYVDVVHIDKPVYLEADFSIDDQILAQFKADFINAKQQQVIVEGAAFKLNNRHKTVGGQTAIDIERMLSYELDDDQLAANTKIYTNQHKRRYLAPDSLIVRTHGSAGQSYAAFNNDGMRMEHTGTCNDGVGKSACGGTIIIKSPGGGHKVPGENVLVGNFTLFGATGGKTFINGEAGDRFAVRNSGAMAVVEGVGDFACEYMTNGAVLNIGTFGKGFCNGMSGGNAYQYDPEDKLQHLYDVSSVEIRDIIEDSDTARAHEQFVIAMLEQHAEYAESSVAQKLLNNWENERQHFKFAIPLWLYKTQTAEFIAKTVDRKVIIEELAVDQAQQQIIQVQEAYVTKAVLFGGQTPDYGATDSPLAFKMINSFAVLNKATIIAAAQVQSAQQTKIVAQRLITTKARRLQDALVKETREAYANYDDAQLALLLANKRLNDYKQALILRDVQSIYSIGSTNWIIEQTAINNQALADIPGIDEYLAALNSKTVIQDMLKTKEAA
ncbi:glutamate synthase (NADPH/NADH) large chain [Bathymodiolus japonicus methanotrophic gill symbiont]|uniref:glutamate synthase-related protein n=1 Tax=Bathymodiolus japonicus methanotrophic gill symbiont TaxID=113269 RepID=UPI001B4491D0|nr:glutamate synthase-related protein [Bathymodiolus japonicus methanotrophic gill symbiont]GFO70923.1 glutamate synthase (NADPH/NADH) large chain [Bathymodiolus japonicus methanotrophic gill symbiont]